MNSFADEIIPLGMTGDYINGLGFKENDWSSEGHPIIRIQNLTNSAKPFNRTLREVDDRFKVQNGDILVSWSATLDAFIWRRGAAILNQHIFKVVPDTKRVDPGFLFYQLKSIIWQMSHGEHAHGSTMKHINRKPFLSHPFWCPTISQQREIAMQLDRSFSGLENCENHLKHLQTKLKQARASILKAAVEGRLVETEAELARVNGIQFKRGGQLLVEISSIAKRRNQGMNMEASGHDEQLEIDGLALPIPPEGWSWTTMKAIASTVRNGYSGKPTDQGPVKILRISSVRPLSVDHTDTRSLPGIISDYGKAIAQNGCLLITRYNGNPNLVGVMGHYRSQDPVVHPDKLIRVELTSEMIRPEWIEIAFNTGLTRSLLQKRVRTTAGQAGISGQDVKSMPVPVPPTEEQIRIIQEVQRRFSVLDQVEVTVQASLTRCGMLRQAILKRAFGG